MESTPLTISLLEAIDPPWTALLPVRLGAVPRGNGTPDLFVLVAEAQHPLLRIDLYRSRESELYVRDEAIAWKDWIVVGFGYRAFLIHSHNRRVREIPLPLYFEGFLVGEGFLLILAGQGLVCLDAHGEIAWTNADLAIDGLEVTSVEGGIIRGRGDWDPPGGWRTFEVRLDTGESIAQAV